jgi:anti-sigma B factor antagonist
VQNEFRLDVRRTDRATVVSVSGELDIVSSAELEEALEGLEGSEARSIILDLTDVEFMDSAGLAVVVRAHQRAENAGTPFTLVTGSPQVRRLLSVTGMDARITVAETSEELLGGG